MRAKALTDAQKVRRLKMQLKENDGLIDSLERDLRDAIVQRDEARRWSVPFHGNSDAINFRPIYVKSIEINRPSETHQSWNSQISPITVYGRAIATIVCEGDVM